MHRPQPAEEYITVIDNKGRERIQHVEYIVTDVRGETVYVTAGRAGQPDPPRAATRAGERIVRGERSFYLRIALFS